MSELKAKEIMSVADLYMKYTPNEKASTDIEEKLVNNTILCILDNVKKGLQEFQELSNKENFIRRIVHEVYSKNTDTLFDFIDMLLDEVEIKFWFLWATYEEVVFNEGYIGTKTILEKFDVLTKHEEYKKFSQNDQIQVKIIRYHLKAIVKEEVVVLTDEKQKNDQIALLDAKISSIQLELASWLNEFISLSLSVPDDRTVTMGFLLKSVNSGNFFHNTLKLKLPKTVQLIIWEQPIFITRGNSSSLCILQKEGNDDTLWCKKSTKDDDKWVFELDKRRVQFYLKNLTIGKYLYVSEDYCSNEESCRKIKVTREKEDKDQLKWTISYRTDNTIEIFNVKYEYNGLFVDFPHPERENGFVCLNSEGIDHWKIKEVE